MMDTTLVTFIIDCEPGTRCVDLYGSWDNFQKPYPLSKDRQMGHGRWHGCHRFRNIICDGDPSQHTAPRQGELKAGGIYWFYFKINDDLECPNMRMPTTTKCLLLPGQIVNVLEIPLLDHDDIPQASVEPILELSLDPDDRKTTFGPDARAVRRRTNSRKALDMRRLEHLEKSLGRLKTAAGHTHMLTCLGYAAPQRLNIAQSRRPMTTSKICQTSIPSAWLPKRTMRVDPTAGEGQQPGPQYSSASGTLASAREHPTMQRSFSNPFRRPRKRLVSSGATYEAKSAHHHTLSTVEESRSIPVPTFANPKQPSKSRHERETQSVHTADNSTNATAVSKEYDKDSSFTSNLQLRLACARLEVARAEANSQAALESAQQRLPSAPNTDLVISQKYLENPALHELTHNHHPFASDLESETIHTQSEMSDNAGSSNVSAFSTPASTTPISLTASTSTWGSPFRLSTYDDTHTPITDYGWHGSRSRASHLYSIANSRDGLGHLFDDLSLASQETIKLDQLENGTASLLQVSSASTSLSTHLRSDSQQAQEIDTSTHNGPVTMIGDLTSDLTYLGSAISTSFIQ